MRGLDELERASLLLVLLGLATIYVASVAYDPPHVSLPELDESFIGDTVQVTANVTSVRKTDAAQFVRLAEGESRITAVYFGNENLEATPRLIHTVEGEVDVYKGELEVILHDIEPVRK